VSDAVAVVWDEALRAYDFGPGHPLAPIRVQLAMRLAREFGLLESAGVEVLAPVVPATIEQIAAVHELEYIAAVQHASEHPQDADPLRGLGTPDDPAFAGMHDASALVAGATLMAAQAVHSGRAEHAVNIAGGLHHAMPGSASGFCIYNDAAVAIQALLDAGAARDRKSVV
jgi:acetoin utilization protein AcuC